MLIKNCRMIIDGEEQFKDILVENEKIVSIEDDLSGVSSDEIIDAAGNYVISGVIEMCIRDRDNEENRAGETNRGKTRPRDRKTDGIRDRKTNGVRIGESDRARTGRRCGCIQ